MVIHVTIRTMTGQEATMGYWKLGRAVPINVSYIVRLRYCGSIGSGGDNSIQIQIQTRLFSNGDRYSMSKQEIKEY